MVNPEWGTKRSCPKCGTRFYDLGKDDPITSINCGVAWQPEAVLKSKQPQPYESAPKKDAVVADTEDSDLADEDLAIEEEEEQNPDDEVDLGGDDDLDVAVGDEEEEI